MRNGSFLKKISRERQRDVDLSIWELVKTVIIGIVEGLTEWLPISSTGHMILVDEFIRLDVSKAFMDMFLVVIQLGAILAVVVMNFDRLNPFSPLKTRKEKQRTVDLWLKVIIACIPAAVIGLMFNDYMEKQILKLGGSQALDKKLNIKREKRYKGK